MIAEKIDRISRLPLPEAEKLIASIRDKSARLAILGIVDLSDVVVKNDGVFRIVLESAQELLLKLAIQTARDDYEIRRERQWQGVQLAKAAVKYAGRKADLATHERIIILRQSGLTIERTATLAGAASARSNASEQSIRRKKIRDLPCLGWFTMPVNFLSEDQKADYGNIIANWQRKHWLVIFILMILTGWIFQKSEETITG